MLVDLFCLLKWYHVQEIRKFCRILFRHLRFDQRACVQKDHQYSEVIVAPLWRAVDLTVTLKINNKSIISTQFPRITKNSILELSLTLTGRFTLDSLAFHAHSNTLLISAVLTSIPLSFINYTLDKYVGFSPTDFTSI